MTIPTYSATINGSTLNELMYAVIQIDTVYKSTYNTPLVQFNQKYLTDKLIYKLCELDTLCCLYNGNIHCILYSSNNQNNETIQNTLQQFIDQHSNDHNAKWKNTIQYSDDNDIPDTILQQCVQTYVEFMLHKQFNMFKHTGNVYVQLDVNATQQYTANAVYLSIPLDRLNPSSNKKFNILLESQQYMLKPITHHTLRQATLFEHTDEPVDVYVLPKSTQMYIVQDNNNRATSINKTDMIEYWLYKYHIQLPAQYDTVNVQYKYDSAALQYPIVCVLDATITKIKPNKSHATDFVPNITNVFNTIQLYDMKNNQKLKLFDAVKTVPAADDTPTNANKQKLFTPAAAV